MPIYRWRAIYFTATLCAVIFVAAQVNHAYQISSDSKATPVELLPTAAHKTAPAGSTTNQLPWLLNENRLISLAPFGKIKAEDLLPSDYTELPDSSLEVRIAGTFTHQDRSRASALLSINGEAQKYHRVGDEIEDGIILYDVTNTGVVFQRNEEFEKLFFEDAALKQPEKTSPSVSRPVQISSANPLHWSRKNDLIRLELKQKMAAFEQTNRPSNLTAEVKSSSSHIAPGV